MFFLCRLMECKSFFYANYLNWSLTSPFILDTHSAVEPSSSRNLTEIVVYKYSAHCFSLDFGDECFQRRKESLSVFVLDSKTKEDDKIVLQRVGFEISRERQGLLLQSRKMAKRWQSSWKTIETTAESSLTSFLASGTSFFGREAVRRAMKSREVPRHIKIGRRTVLKVYCSRREASRKIPGITLLSIFPGKCSTFRKCIEYKWAWLNLACPVWKWKLRVTNNQWCFLDNRKDQREQSLCSSVVGFRF